MGYNNSAKVIVINWKTKKQVAESAKKDSLFKEISNTKLNEAERTDPQNNPYDKNSTLDRITNTFNSIFEAEGIQVKNKRIYIGGSSIARISNGKYCLSTSILYSTRYKSLPGSTTLSIARTLDYANNQVVVSLKDGNGLKKENIKFLNNDNDITSTASFKVITKEGNLIKCYEAYIPFTSLEEETNQLALEVTDNIGNVTTSNCILKKNSKTNRYTKDYSPNIYKFLIYSNFIARATVSDNNSISSIKIYDEMNNNKEVYSAKNLQKDSQIEFNIQDLKCDSNNIYKIKCVLVDNNNLSTEKNVQFIY